MSKRKKQQHGNPARQGMSFAHRLAVRRFSEWDWGRPSPEQVRLLEQLFHYAQAHGLDPLDGFDTADLVEILVAADEEDPASARAGASRMDVEAAVEVLDLYVQMQRQSAPPESDEREAWDIADASIAEALDVDDPLAATLSDAIADGALIDPGIRMAALRRLPVVAGIPELLRWLGSGKPQTSTGGLRRADIAPVAALLGLEAVGAASNAPAAEGGPRRVRSMWDLPPLASWWEAALTSGIIDSQGTRVVPGPEAAGWLTPEGPAVTEAELLAASFVAHLITYDVDDVFDALLTEVFHLRIERLVEAFDPEGAATTPYGGDRSLWSVVARPLDELVRHGYLTRDADGVEAVEEPLRGTVARAIVMALAFRASVRELGDGRDDEPSPFPADGAGSLPVGGSSPFDDPEVAEFMARHGIVHKPGMAAQHLAEMAPLLADEGIDLDNLQVDDLDSLNAALARARERRNLELATPTGEHLTRSRTVLALVAEAIAEGSDPLASAIMASIPSDPTPEMPSVAHVIGTGLGLLDEWNRVDASAFVRLKAPKWERVTMIAANEIYARAREGRAFASMDAFIWRYAGKAVLDATLLAVAGAAVARAGREGIAVRDFVTRELRE